MQFRKHGLAVAESRFDCSKCNFKSTNLAGLKAHLRSHEEKVTTNKKMKRLFLPFNHSFFHKVARGTGLGANPGLFISFIFLFNHFTAEPQRLPTIQSFIVSADEMKEKSISTRTIFEHTTCPCRIGTLTFYIFVRLRLLPLHQTPRANIS
jgi:hypothetical protein